MAPASNNAAAIQNCTNLTINDDEVSITIQFDSEYLNSITMPDEKSIFFFKVML